MLYLVNASPVYPIPKANSCYTVNVTRFSNSYVIPSGCRGLTFYSPYNASSPIYIKFGTSSSVTATTNNAEADMIIPDSRKVEISLKVNWTHFAAISALYNQTLLYWGFE